MGEPSVKIELKVELKIIIEDMPVKMMGTNYNMIFANNLSVIV